MTSSHHYLYTFPKILSFLFVRIDNKHTINLHFPSETKISHFIEDTYYKLRFAFNISQEQNIEIIPIEKNSQTIFYNKYDNLDITLSQKYYSNYRHIKFHVYVS